MDLDYGLLINKAEGGDPLAMYELANLYDLEVIPDRDGFRRIFWLTKFWESREVQIALLDYDPEEETDEVIDPLLEMALRDPIIEAGLSLGLYYMTSTDIKEAQFALQCLYGAWIASGRDYISPEELDGKTDILGLMQRQNEWILELGVNECADSNS